MNLHVVWVAHKDFTPFLLFLCVCCVSSLGALIQRAKLHNWNEINYTSKLFELFKSQTHHLCSFPSAVHACQIACFTLNRYHILMWFLHFRYFFLRCLLLAVCSLPCLLGLFWAKLPELNNCNYWWKVFSRTGRQSTSAVPAKLSMSTDALVTFSFVIKFC